MKALTPKELEQLRTLLVAARHSLLERHRRQVAQVNESFSEVRAEDDDAAWSEVQHTHAGLGRFVDELLRRIDAALRRLEDGTYGFDEVTHEPIAFARLKVIPWATRTLEQEERRERLRAA
jgi:DnaK suppressor protein